MKPRPSTPAHLAGLDPESVSAPSTSLSSGRLVAGGTEFEGEVTIEEWVDPETAPRKGGRPKIKREHIPTHFQT